MKDDTFNKEFRMFDKDDSKDYAELLQEYEKNFDPSVLESLINAPESLNIIKSNFEELLKYRKLIREAFPNCPSSIMLPINVPRIIKNIKKNNRLKYAGNLE